MESLNEEDKEYDDKLRLTNTLMLCKIGFYSRFCDRNEYEYDKITKEYLEILESYQNNYGTTEYDIDILDNYPINSIAVLVMTVHEFITHLDDPGHLGFNYIELNHVVAADHK